jgi:hypothetical protein
LCVLISENAELDDQLAELFFVNYSVLVLIYPFKHFIKRRQKPFVLGKLEVQNGLHKLLEEELLLGLLSS